MFFSMTANDDHFRIITLHFKFMFALLFEEFKMQYLPLASRPILMDINGS